MTAPGQLGVKVDDGGVVGGVEIFEHVGGAGGGAEGGAHVVFDGEGDAVEEAGFGAGFTGGVGGVGLLEGAFGEDGVEGVEVGVEFVDGVEAMLRGLAGGDGAGGDLSGELGGAEGGEGGGHGLRSFVHWFIKCISIFVY